MSEQSLPKENDYGDTEYKLILHIDDDYKREGLVTQMKYRLNAGMGECIYYLGVHDNGNPVGILPEEMEYSIKNLDVICKAANAEWSIINKQTNGSGFEVCSILIRETNPNSFIDLKFAIIGNVDSGKSTFLGVLTSGQLDDGRGSARVNVFNHRHEIKTGRTSSKSFHIVGFDGKGQMVNDGMRRLEWAEIVRESKKVVTFVDLPGHQKYLKTAMKGFSDGAPDYAIILVGANMGVAGPHHNAGSGKNQILNMTREHILMCLSNKIPFLILLSKIDMSPEDITNQTIADLKQLLQGIPSARCVLFEIKNDDDLMTTISTLPTPGTRVVPMIRFSSKTGENIPMIKRLLNLLPVRVAYDEHAPLEISTIETFHTQGIGTILHGFIHKGQICKDDEVIVGPDSLGNYMKSKVKSIHLKRMPVNSVKAGHHVCLALRNMNRDYIKRGMVVMHSSTGNPISVRKFEADICILKTHCTTIRSRYEPVLNMGNIRQVAKILEIDSKPTARERRDMLRPGDRSLVVFSFKFKPEFVKEGNKFSFTEGHTRGIGVVTRIMEND